MGCGPPARGHDHGHADLAHHRVGPGDDRDRGDGGMLGEHRLDLHRVHVVAAADVHLLAPADEPQPALVVDPAEVARAHRAVGVERGARWRRGRASSPLITAGDRRHTAPTSPGGDRPVVVVEHRQRHAGERTPDADLRVLLGVGEGGAECRWPASVQE